MLLLWKVHYHFDSSPQWYLNMPSPYHHYHIGITIIIRVILIIATITLIITIIMIMVLMITLCNDKYPLPSRLFHHETSWDRRGMKSPSSFFLFISLFSLHLHLFVCRWGMIFFLFNFFYWSFCLSYIESILCFNMKFQLLCLLVYLW